MTPAEPSQQSADTAGLSTTVTTVVRRRVRRGREADYEAWVAQLQRRAGDLDGHLGAETRSTGTPRQPEYTSIFRFATLSDREAFERSELNRRALADVADLVEADPVWDTYTGLELWFTPPNGTLAPQPVRWRMALVLGTVVYVLVLAFGTLATAVAGNVPVPIRLLIVITIEIILMTYLILPAITRRLARWIYPTTRQP
jgi:hypothetical protein